MLTDENKSRNIYFDYAAATPLAPEVFSAMKPFFDEEFGNAGSQHEHGTRAKQAIQDARADCAHLLGAKSNEIIFTGSGTESNNLAIFGLIREHLSLGAAFEDMHLVTSVIEHPSVLDCFKYLEEKGATVSYVGVNHEGVVDAKEVEQVLTEKTKLVSIMMVNNEMGAIQPIKDIGKLIQKYNKDNTAHVAFHTDASQAGLFLDINVRDLHVDLLTLDGQKVYGPKGVGLLYKKEGIGLKPYMIGGNQEMSLRPGTENTPSIVGFSAAMSLVADERLEEIKRITELRDFCIAEVSKHVPKAEVNGPWDSHKEFRIPNNVNISIPGIEGEFLVIALSQKGFSCGTRSACIGQKGGPSYVIGAMKEAKFASSSLRLSFGRKTTKADVLAFVPVLESVVNNFDNS